MTAIGTSNDVAALLDRINPKLAEVKARSTKDLKDEISAMEYRLNTLPTDQEIEARRDKWAGLLNEHLASYLNSGVPLFELPFEHQKKIIRLFFGGKDELGRRYGIYVRDMGGNPRYYHFEAYGKLGAIKGGVESKSGEYYSDSYEPWLRDDKELGEGIARVLLEADPVIFGDNSKAKVHMLSERHAHHRLGLHQ